MFLGANFAKGVRSRSRCLVLLPAVALGEHFAASCRMAILRASCGSGPASTDPFEPFEATAAEETAAEEGPSSRERQF